MQRSNNGIFHFTPWAAEDGNITATQPHNNKWPDDQCKVNKGLHGGRYNRPGPEGAYFWLVVVPVLADVALGYSG